MQDTEIILIRWCELHETLEFNVEALTEYIDWLLEQHVVCFN